MYPRRILTSCLFADALGRNWENGFFPWKPPFFVTVSDLKVLKYRYSLFSSATFTVLLLFQVWCWSFVALWNLQRALMAEFDLPYKAVSNAEFEVLALHVLNCSALFSVWIDDSRLMNVFFGFQFYPRRKSQPICAFLILRMECLSGLTLRATLACLLMQNVKEKLGQVADSIGPKKIYMPNGNCCYLLNLLAIFSIK